MKGLCLSDSESSCVRVLHGSAQWPLAYHLCRMGQYWGVRGRKRLAHLLAACSGLEVPVSGCNKSVRCRRQPHGANTH